MSYIKFFFVLTPVISLLFGVFALSTDPESYASYFLPYFCLNLACSVLLQGGVANFVKSEVFNLIKMHVLMKSISGLFQRKASFKVTPKSRAAAAQISEVILPLVLGICLVLAGGIGVVRLQHAPRWGYLFWALNVNMFWSLIFLFMMGVVLWRSLGRKEARSAYRFRAHLDVPMRLSYTTQDGRLVDLEHFARNLNRSGVSVTLDEAILPGTEVAVELWLPDRNVRAQAQVVRNHTYKVNRQIKISSGMRFTSINASDQDAISTYLFWQIAPKESAMLTLTHGTQAEDMA